MFISFFYFFLSLFRTKTLVFIHHYHIKIRWRTWAFCRYLQYTEFTTNKNIILSDTHFVKWTLKKVTPED